MPADSKNTRQFLLKKNGATLDELKAFALTQTLDFSDEEKQLVNEGVSKIEAWLSALGGVSLPFPSVITFVKTTMLEESEPTAYTQKMEIFLGKNLLTSVLQNTSSLTNCFNRILSEECMANNFSFAIMRGEEGIAAGEFKTPEIISEILSVLKKDYSK